MGSTAYELWIIIAMTRHKDLVGSELGLWHSTDIKSYKRKKQAPMEVYAVSNCRHK